MADNTSIAASSEQPTQSEIHLAKIEEILKSDEILANDKPWRLTPLIRNARVHGGSVMSNVCDMIHRKYFYHNTAHDRSPIKSDGWWGIYQLLREMTRPYYFKSGQEEYNEAFWAMHTRTQDTWKRHQLTENVVFLDIDGVLQGDWTWPAKGFFNANPTRFLRDPNRAVADFDQHFLWFLRGLADVVPNLSFVLCSTWRGILRQAYLDMFAHYTGLPFAGCTGHSEHREDECLNFMVDNPIIQRSITIDDEIYDVGARLKAEPRYNDAGYRLENTHFRIDNINGPRVEQMKAMCEVFGTTFYDVCRSNTRKRGDKQK